MTPEETGTDLERRQAELRSSTLQQFRRAGSDPVTQALLRAVLEYRLEEAGSSGTKAGTLVSATAPGPSSSEESGNGASDASLAALTLQSVLADMGQLPALPEVVIDLIAYLERPDVEANQVAHKMARDPALCAKILRIANSSYYGLQGQVETIRDAFAVLGLRAVRTLVAGAAVANHLQALAGRQQRAFWVHSAGTALCSRALARQVGANPEVAFTAGLLHDLGRLILVARFANEYHGVVAYRIAHDGYMIDAERRVLGFDHAQVGAALAQIWKFSAETVAAITGHHAPEGQPAQALAGLIHVADVMAHALGFNGNEEDLMPRLSSFAWNRLNLGWDDFRRLLAEVDAQRNDAEWVLN